MPPAEPVLTLRDPQPVAGVSLSGLELTGLFSRSHLQKGGGYSSSFNSEMEVKERASVRGSSLH